MQEGAEWACATGLRPKGFHDLRADSAPASLRYGPTDVLVVAGLPGAGKSTLMARCAGARLVDSRDTRLRFQARLPRWLPYRPVRPVVRAAHFWRLWTALRDGGPLVMHDFGALPAVRTWVAHCARRQGRPAHLLVVDADPVAARAAQTRRGRAVPPRRFARHQANAQLLLKELGVGSAPSATPWKSATLLSRATAEGVRTITFGAHCTGTCATRTLLPHPPTRPRPPASASTDPRSPAAAWPASRVPASAPRVGARTDDPSSW